jgi:hypothetical protein
MFKKILASFGAFVGATSIVVAANLSLVTGPQDPSQINATLNTLIQSINTSVSRIGVGAASVASSATTAEQILYSYTLPGGLLANAGDSVRVTCWGVDATNSDNKAQKLYFGSAAITTATAATSNKGWRLQMTVMRQTATAQGVDSFGQVDTTAVTPASSSATETLANAITIKCTTTTAGTASDVTGTGFLVEAIR